jgi:glycosyltransferase involved in cell wall biosynthesis
VTTLPWGRAQEGESFGSKLTQRARDVLAVRRAVRSSAFDVAVVKTAHDWHTVVRDILVVLAIRARCRPVILQFHGSRAANLVEPGHYGFKLATKVLLSLVDGAFVLSSEEQRQWQTFRRSVPVFVVKNPYVGLALPARSESDGVRSPVLLFVGRLMKEKGVFEVVGALPKVLEETECHLVVVGAGSEEHELRSQIGRLELEGHVTLTGYLSGSDLIRRYQESTVFVLPTSWIEGFPTVLTEAMDAGLAIVTTPIRGAADHLVEGENVLFVESGDIDALAAAISTLLRDPALRDRMAAANRDVLRRFEPDVVAAEYLEILESLAGERRGAEAGA